MSTVHIQPLQYEKCDGKLIDNGCLIECLCSIEKWGMDLFFKKEREWALEINKISWDVVKCGWVSESDWEQNMNS